MRRKFNYINGDVEIDFSYPKYFQRYIDDMEAYDANDDYPRYNSVCEPFVYTICKNCYASGVLTKEQYEKFQRRYLL